VEKVNSRQWTVAVDSEQWTADSEQRTVDTGHRVDIDMVMVMDLNTEHGHVQGHVHGLDT
jgi:hypothetical protein